MNGLLSYNTAFYEEISKMSRIMKKKKKQQQKKKQIFAYVKTKAQNSCAVTAQLISAFVFTTRIVQSLFFVNTNFQASSLLL